MAMTGLPDHQKASLPLLLALDGIWEGHSGKKQTSTPLCQAGREHPRAAGMLFALLRRARALGAGRAAVTAEAHDQEQTAGRAARAKRRKHQP